MSEVAQPEKCAECGAAIGRHESPYLFNDKNVCAGCYQRLAGQGDVSSADTVVLPKSKEQIARRTDTLPFAVLSQWRPDHPAYQRLKRRERERQTRRAVGAVAGILAMAGMLTAIVGGGQGNHAVLAAGAIGMVVGLIVVFVALW
jgi:hypothetical protein